MINMQTEGAHIDKIIHSTLDLWKDSGKLSSIEICGNSMKPLLHNGSRVLIEHCSSSVNIEDIIVYYRNNGLIAHRVIRIKTDEQKRLYLTKGDSALRFDDPLVSEKEIVGVVRGIVKESKTIHLTGWRWRIFGKVMAASSLIVGISADIAHPLLGCIKAIRKKYRHHISE